MALASFVGYLQTYKWKFAWKIHIIHPALAICKQFCPLHCLHFKYRDTGQNQTGYALAPPHQQAHDRNPGALPVYRQLPHVSEVQLWGRITENYLSFRNHGQIPPQQEGVRQAARSEAAGTWGQDTNTYRACQRPAASYRDWQWCAPPVTASPKHQGLQPFLKIYFPIQLPALLTVMTTGRGWGHSSCHVLPAQHHHCTAGLWDWGGNTALLGGYKTRLQSCIPQMYSHLCEADWRQERVGELAAL